MKEKMSSNLTLNHTHTKSKTEMFIETLVMVIIFLIGAIGNPLTGLLIYRNKRLRNLHNMLIINLIFADSIATFLYMPTVIITMAAGKWVFGSFFCHFTGFLSILLATTCLWTILWLSVMRLLMLTKPHWYALIVMPKYVFSIIACSWLMAFISSGIVYAAGGFAFKQEYALCSFVFDDLASLALVMIPLVILPVGIVSAVTVIIVVKIRRKRDKNKIRYREEEREVASTYVILVLVYVLCYIPVFIIEAHYASSKGGTHHIGPILATYLGLLPFSVKTFITVLNKKVYRKEVIALLCSRRNRVNVADGNFQSAWHTAMLHERRRDVELK